MAEPARSADRDVLDAGILEVQRMRVALAAVADDRDLLALDEIEVGIAIVIDAHVTFPSWLTSDARGFRPACWPAR